jgi:NTE family protein
MGLYGFTYDGIQKLNKAWGKTVDRDLLPHNLWWQTMQSFFRRNVGKGLSQDRIREFAISNGLTSDLRFKDLGVRVYPVAADLNSVRPVIFGLDPEESVLDCVLASMALPPWMAPIERNGYYLMDGGAVSNLPIEAALLQGATEIIALDLFDQKDIPSGQNGFGNFFAKLDLTIENRQAELEMNLAAAHGVPVRHIKLTSEPPVPLWDFRHSIELIERGYQLTTQAISTWPRESQPSWWRRLGIKAMLEDLIDVM